MYFYEKSYVSCYHDILTTQQQKIADFTEQITKNVYFFFQLDQFLGFVKLFYKLVILGVYYKKI